MILCSEAVNRAAEKGKWPKCVGIKAGTGMPGILPDKRRIAFSRRVTPRADIRRFRKEKI